MDAGAGAGPVLWRMVAQEECARGADAVLFAAGILSVIWIVIGYTLAFTEGNPFFGA